MKKSITKSKELPPCGERYVFCNNVIFLRQETRGSDDDPNNGVLITYYETACGGIITVKEPRCSRSA